MSAHEDKNDFPMLPPGGIMDEAGEETMESVNAGLLGSSGPLGSGSDTGATSAGGSDTGATVRPGGPVEAEFVSEPGLDDTQASAMDPSIDETLNFGSDTLAAMKAAATRKLGDFELERKIGQGGMGEVWLARQVSLDRPVAVKVLPRSLATQENFIERFQREAKAAASLVHPSVIQIYAYGIDEGTPYFAMEYVEGEDLQQRIRRERLLDWDEVVAILMSVTSALEVAHEKGIVHRDIKPSNIMIDKKGIVKVMDFGLAKATSGGPEAKNLTNAGLIMGTPNYLAPEQGRGDPLDGRSDLYSLGIVFYELLTGQLPFKADSPAGLIFKHVYEPPPPPLDLRPEIPPFLVEITLKLLEKDPDDRYRNAKEFHDDLKSFYDNYDHYLEGGEALPPSREHSGRSSASGVVAALPGRRPSPSSRRNAITEPVTKPIELAEFPNEPPSSEEDEIETLLENPGDPNNTVVAATKNKGPAKRKAPPPPPKKSKAPLVVLALLCVLAAGGAYAWTQHNAETRSFLSQLGLLKPGEGPGPQGSPSPAGSEGPITNPSTDPIISTPPTGDEVDYSFEGEWPKEIEIYLARAKHDPIKLRHGSTGRYSLGDDYRISFERAGYEPISFPVRLVRRDGGTRGVVLDSEGNDVAETQLTWKPSLELRQAYRTGQEALLAARFSEAEKALTLAASLDPGYRPPSDSSDHVNPSVADLQKRLETRQRESAKAGERLAQLVESARGQAESSLWREAIGQLDRWPKQEELPKEAGALRTAWEAEIKRGGEILTRAEKAIARGDHAEAEEDLKALAKADPANPEKGKLEERLGLAKDARAAALNTNGSLSSQCERVLNYVTNFGPKDSELLARQKVLDGQVSKAQQVETQYKFLKGQAKAGKWESVRKGALALQKENPGHPGLQDLLDEAEQAIATEQVTALLTRLDGALIAAESDQAIRLLDPKSKAYELEKGHLQRVSHVGSFVESTHEIVGAVDVQGGYAQVKTLWRFRIKVLDQPVKSFRATHVLQLRQVVKGARGDAAWLISELKVEGKVDAQ